MATPITTPNYRHFIDKMSFDGFPVEGGAGMLGSVSERLESRSNGASLEAVI